MGNKLKKSAANKKLAGICGGFAEHFNIDPDLVRVLWIVGSIFGAGLPAYIVCLIMMED